MNNNHKQIAVAHNFSTAFEQMCSIMAIGKTRNRSEVLAELVLQCLAFLPNEKISSAADIRSAIDGLLGIRIPEHEIQFSLDKLIEAQSIMKRADESFSLPQQMRKTIQDEIDETHRLDEDIRKTWAEEVASKYPALEFDKLWKSLRVYLAGAFQRHGIQAVAMLDPSVEISDGYSESLSSILVSVISKEFPKESRSIATSAVSEFMATTGNHPRRAKYISQLADGAFNYYSLTIDAKIAEDFQKNLNQLDLFFDTNFLFGILDITVNPQVAVSNELLAAIKKYKLPFRLYSHQKTVTELLGSINHYADVLSERKWSQPISRAAVYSRHLSGVELRYHQRFAEEGIDVESFFRPYKHSDVLLKDKGIIPFNPQENHLAERSNLINEYKEFLAKIGKEKYYEQIDHDMTVLDIVRQKRTGVKSSLDAGALFITCDYTLYKFDWETSKAKGIRASTVLPNIFWQILRPFIPSDVDFDNSFAETFAIPEFRIFGSQASLACSKMLNILAGYKDFAEETAKRLLSNGMLIEALQHVPDDKSFQDLVEAEIVKENAALVEEREFIAAKYEKERKEKELARKELEIEAEKNLHNERAIAEIQELSQMKIEHERLAAQVSEQRAKDAERARIAAERKAEESNKEAEKAREESRKEKEKTNLIIGIAKSTSIGLVFVAIFEILVLNWNFASILDHPKYVSIQLSIDTILLLFPFAFFIPKLRLWILAACIGLLGVLYPLLDK